MTPVRIQRKREKGWRLPENTVCVTRGTHYGNPYKIDAYITRELSLTHFRNHLNLMKQRDPCRYEDYISPLRGKNVACFCAKTERCHGDILLEFANE